MNIFFVSNGIWEYDGRLRELVEISCALGRTKYITRAIRSEKSEEHIGITKDSYIFFIFQSVYQAFKLKAMDILFIDNRKAIIPSIIIMILKKPKTIILDVRELYLLKEVKHIQGKIGCYFESFMIRRADVIISANKQRSKIMQEYYKLNEAPLVYENIRKLEYSKNYNEAFFRRKYSSLLKRNTCKIISTSGYSVDRTNDRLVVDMEKLGGQYELLLVGGGTSEDKSIIEKLISEKKLLNITLIDMVDADELKFLIQNCDIGIVNYHQKDLNNKYCASGKIYEFLFEGIPIVTTENEPLKEFCEIYKVGESNNIYSIAILNVTKKYDYYKNNVLNFIQQVGVSENNLKICSELSKKIKGYKKYEER